MKTCSKRAKAVILLLLIAVAATAVFSGCSSKNVESVIVNGDFEASATGAAGWSISDYQNDFLNNGAASDVYIGDGKDGKIPGALRSDHPSAGCEQAAGLYRTADAGLPPEPL